MLVFDTNSEIVGWLDRPINARSDVMALQSVLEDPWEIPGRLSPVMSNSVTTEAVRIDTQRFGFRVDPETLTRMGLETNQFRNGASHEIARLVATRIRNNLPAIIALDAPRHTDVSVAEDAMRMDFTFRITVRALFPTIEQAEMLFDMDDFMPIDQSRYATGDMPSATLAVNSRVPSFSRTSPGMLGGSAIGGPVSNSNAVDWTRSGKGLFYSGLTVKRPESHISVTGIS